jgi:hypothetical protein
MIEKKSVSFVLQESENVGSVTNYENVERISYYGIYGNCRS